jgi:alkyldihydroxyacetonephosphate synthase
MLKPGARGWAAIRRRAERLFVTRLRGFAPKRMVACTLVFEGTRAHVAREEAGVRRLARRHGGMRGGSENGRKGYQLTFGIAYFRDFIMRHYILGESFETSVPWSQAADLCTNVKRRLTDEYIARQLPGRPFITCRITQLYQTGVAIYFYFGFHHKGLDRPAEIFAELEHAARDEILRSGGSLSHHHGIGRIRRGFLPRVFSTTSLEWSAAVKRAIDPSNTFGTVQP